MPKTNPNKKARKPTQLDRIEKLERELRNMDARFVTRFAHLSRRQEDQATLIEQHRENTVTAFRNSGARHDALESRLPAPQEQEPEKWVPTLNELAVVSKTGAVGIVRRIEHNSGDTFYWIGDKEQHGGWLLVNIRKPSSSEIAAHKEAEEERKRKEQEAAELAKPLSFGMPVKLKAGREGIYMGKDHGSYTIAFPFNDKCELFDYTRDQFTIITP